MLSIKKIAYVTTLLKLTWPYITVCFRDETWMRGSRSEQLSSYALRDLNSFTQNRRQKIRRRTVLTSPASEVRDSKRNTRVVESEDFLGFLWLHPINCSSSKNRLQTLTPHFLKTDSDSSNFENRLRLQLKTCDSTNSDSTTFTFFCKDPYFFLQSEETRLANAITLEDNRQEDVEVHGWCQMAGWSTRLGGAVTWKTSRASWGGTDWDGTSILLRLFLL